MLRLVDEFRKIICEKLSERGQGMTEYGIILAVVATVSVIVFMSGGGRNFGNAVDGQYQRASDTINKIEISEE